MADGHAQPIEGQETLPAIPPVQSVQAQNVPVTPMDLIARALERGDGLDVVEKLMTLQERWEANQARKAFDEAIAGAKGEIPNIKKTRKVGFDSKAGGARTDYMHEDFAEIAKTVNPILARYGLSYRFRTHYEPNHPVSVTCILSHKAGHCEENTLPAPPDNSGNKNSIQAIGSTVTYLQRYTLKAALGLAAEHDDDAKAAGGDEAISDEQAEEIRRLIETSGTDIAKFCQFHKVPAVTEITKKQYPNALAMLAAKLKAKKQGGAK